MKTPLRRDLFRFGGGAAAGLLLTPVPWRLATGAALWSQNWSSIPVPPRGEPNVRFTHCALCQAGCAVKARCVGEQPIGLTGAGFALCPYGLTAHHLPFHPARLKQPLFRGNPVPMERAVKALADAMAKRGPGETAAVLDLRPGRTASLLYRRAMASVPDGLYLAPPVPAWGVDVERVKAILSFGQPVLAGWGTPGRIAVLRDRFRLVQVESFQSRTAALADVWLPARPGTEPLLAEGLLRRLEGGRAGSLSRDTGVAPDRIEEAVRLLSQNMPAVALGDDPAVHRLNRFLGAPLVQLPEPPAPADWLLGAAAADLSRTPDRSIHLLVIDESLPGDAPPWNEVERKLTRENSLVFSFAASGQGYARYADYVLPVPVPSETAHDPGMAEDSSAPSFRIAAPLSPAPAGLADPVAAVLAACGLPAVEKPLEQRAAAIHRSRRGALVAFSGEKKEAVKDLSFEQFWKALNEGGRWEDEPGAPARPLVEAERRPHRPVPELESEIPLTVLISGKTAGPATPLMSKLYQESGLRQGSNQAAIHPDTARQCGLPDGARAILQTRCGKCEVRVLFDPGVMPGTVRLVAGPTVLEVCGGSMARAKVVRV